MGTVELTPPPLPPPLARTLKLIPYQGMAHCANFGLVFPQPLDTLLHSVARTTLSVASSWLWASTILCDLVFLGVCFFFFFQFVQHWKHEQGHGHGHHAHACRPSVGEACYQPEARQCVYVDWKWLVRGQWSGLEPSLVDFVRIISGSSEQQQANDGSCMCARSVVTTIPAAHFFWCCFSETTYDAPILFSSPLLSSSFFFLSFLVWFNRMMCFFVISHVKSIGLQSLRDSRVACVCFGSMSEFPTSAGYASSL